ncbi:glmZ(sRNA)-inactivating NTPase [Slackia heliotrinireducens]|uniref:Predicted P-loop-containing kinase n=1 Tax=Slackia heliotrinireducens (strain ATCC 29202 / DSM 20476 / NCTC 11029 / RHS 1) TaxID=471855 RepID=C7N5B2_SLAHD|nr:RNase adapter RapZ [Slackia heliotrinireducens]ACV22097.1 predicted P-loop-containing kinase [Slackia heliotrinireducens DSM 20476]VEH00096.1 glmZ(sRNA)-inactivating NTPase [Slackia heliotrinireducens]
MVQEFSDDIQKSPDASNLVIITGMSGAGRTEAMHVFEDMGYYCIDNLPAGLIKNLLDMAHASNLQKKIAVVCDARNQSYFANLQGELENLQGRNIPFRVLFLDADDEKLVARYKASRRRHPMCAEGMTLAQGIAAERALLYGIRMMARDVVNTSDMMPRQLRSHIQRLYSDESVRGGLAVTVYSFGFKHGAPTDADIVIDVRFLPNPYYDSTLRPLTGLDAPVRDFVMARDETVNFLASWNSLLDTVMPGYVQEGKQQLAIAVGCTGGQHRSVAIAVATGEHLSTQGYRVSVTHRDLHLAESVRRSIYEEPPADEVGTLPSADEPDWA